MKKLNLYLVESPLQLINAMEAASLRMDAENHLYVMLGGRAKSDAQMTRLVSEFAWSEVQYIKNDNKNKLLKPLITALSYYKLAFKLKEKYAKYDLCIFIGEFRSNWMQLSVSLANPNKKYLLDDGDITISVQKKYLIKNKKHPFVFDGTLKTSLKSILYFPVLFFKSKERWRLFTAFDIIAIENQVVEKNNYGYANDRYRSNKVKTDLVYYFGSKYSEANLLTQDIEIDFLKKVFSFYSIKNIRYIPHRDDSFEKINAIKKLGATILEIDLPAEIYILRTEIEPSVICGACSTVLNNVKKITPHIKIQSFLLPINLIGDRHLRDDIKRSYANLADLGVEIIEPYRGAYGKS